MKMIDGLARKHRQSRRRKKNSIKPSYKKVLMTVLVVLAGIWISWSYCLATMALLIFGNADPLETLSERVCVTILGAVIAYSVASTTENISKYGYVGKQDGEMLSDEEAEG